MAKKSTRRAREQEFAFVREVTTLTFLGRVLTYRGFAARLRQIEHRHVEQLRNKTFYAREIRRRPAELLLKEAIARGCSFEVCRTRMRQLETLGFADIETKALHALIYARMARANGHFRIARQVATKMVDELNRSLRRRKSLLAKSNLKAL